MKALAQSSTKVRLPTLLALLLIVSAGVGLRSYWIASVQPAPTHDAKWYFGRAKTFAATRSISVGGRPTAYRPIAYPAVLGVAFWAFGTSGAIVRYLNVVLSAATLLCLFLVTRHLTGSRTAAYCATFVFAAYPTDVAYTSLALAESLFNALMLGGVAAARCRRRTLGFVLSAMCCCAAMLTRAQGALLVPVVGLLLDGQYTRALTRRVLIAGAFCALVACFATPYWIRNARAFGAFVPIANNGGVNLYIGNNPHATGGYRFDKVVSAELPGSLNVKSLGSGGPAEQHIDHEFSQLARSYMMAHPRETLRLWPAKLGELYRSDLIAFDWNIDPRVTHGWIFDRGRRVAQDFYLLLWTLAMFALQAFLVRSRGTIVQVGSGVLVAVVLLWLGVPVVHVVATAVLTLFVLRHGGLRSMRNPHLAATLLVLLTASHLVYFGGPRFHHPMMPWIALLTGTILAGTMRAVTEFWAGHRRRQRKPVV